MQVMSAAFLSLANEILTAAIVIIAVSILLYNLWRNLRNRVARTSGAVLACVTVSYIADVFLSLDPNSSTYAAVLRLHWIGLAFMPAALFHLSDALLATTGLPSRGRRRLGVRFLYLLSLVFVLLAAFSDLVIRAVPVGDVASLRVGPLFGVYVAYFISTTFLAFNTTNRARKRCLTHSTRRRMAYLQFAMLAPAVGVFPYSVLLTPGSEFSLPALISVNVANVLIILMLLFLSYPLSFFGSSVPDRVVKSELLRFFMRGPATGLLVLATILTTMRSSRVLGLPGENFMPFAVVAVVLTWQWTVAMVLPMLETALIYGDEDSKELNKLRELSERLLSRADLMQLMNATLRAIVDYLQVNSAFVVSFEQDGVEVVDTVGNSHLNGDMLMQDRPTLVDSMTNITIIETVPIQQWKGYWIAPLFSLRLTDEKNSPSLIGMLGVQSRSDDVDLTDDEHQRLSMFVRRLEQTLDDLNLQQEIYAALEGLLPQLSMTRARAAEVEYLPGRDGQPQRPPTLPEHDQLVEQVRAALRHYWGGPGLTKSRLLELRVVREYAQEIDNPTHALRAVLQDAIELQRPDGERKTTDPEWTLYNTLDWRYVQGNKVSNVANKLSMSNSNLYRRQRDAIEAVAKSIERMEYEQYE